MQRLSLVVVLLLLAPLAFAQVYKWTDAGGTVHYSEAPPATGTNFKQIKTSGSAEPLAAPATAASTANADKPTAADTASAPVAPVADTPENRATLCASLKTSLATLHGSTPVVMQEKGKPVALDDAQREAQISTAQAQYQQYCQTR